MIQTGNHLHSKIFKQFFGGTKLVNGFENVECAKNPDCAKNYNGDMFRIIGKARSSFHLAVLESIYISTKNRYCVDKRSSFSP